MTFVSGSVGRGADRGIRSAMSKRERSLLVVSPHARTRQEITEYKPFGGRSLWDILRDVAVGVSHCKFKQYDQYVPELFFGEPSSIEHFRKIAVSPVDCEIYRSDEAPA